MGNFSRHHLILGDAMAVVLALAKGRPPSEAMRSICRQWGALCLAANIYTHVRWVPSLRNAADDPSRDQARHLVDSDVAAAQITAWKKSAVAPPVEARSMKKDSAGTSHPVPANEVCCGPYARREGKTSQLPECRDKNTSFDCSLTAASPSEDHT